jgi:hypothetical protein
MPFTGINITVRIHVIIESNVPTCGENPSLGPITFSRSSAGNALAVLVSGIKAKPKVPEVSSAVDLIKSLRRIGFVVFI